MDFDVTPGYAIPHRGQSGRLVGWSVGQVGSIGLVGSVGLVRLVGSVGVGRSKYINHYAYSLSRLINNDEK